MSAFEKVHSGIPRLDQAFDFIRLGDNVVWQVSTLDEFKLFATPFVNQAILDKRNIIYIRFATHPPLFFPQEGLKIVEMKLSHRFETFTVEIHNLITKEGRDAFYVFDCLSELQVAWSTDMMMGNFFRVTCPYLFTLDTVAYFPILRGKHSFDAIAKIRDTTQLLLDVYSEFHHCYVHPLKIWNRYSATMFLPHEFCAENGSFLPLTDGIKVSAFYHVLNRHTNMTPEHNTDSLDRFFSMVRLLYSQGAPIESYCITMCKIMMTRDEKLRALIIHSFSPEDYFGIRRKMIGSGMIGGKACGMLLARKLIEKYLPDCHQNLEPHDSFYIGSDVFYTYIVQNDLWDLRIRQRTESEYFTLAPKLQEKLQNGLFPEDIREQFRRMLDYYGQSPIIVRSSSILEDGFGNAFAGKYESVFCCNQGTLSERLFTFEKAVRTVYASTMDASALEYRKRRGLAGRDEQMALLVQRVSGSRFADYYLPLAAGVGYSFSPYRFLPEIDAKAGMLRIVMGLGTKAVDRTEGDYPRLISLDSPLTLSSHNIAERHRYSQHKLDVISVKENSLVEKELDEIISYVPFTLLKSVLEHDYEAEQHFIDRGQRKDIYFISCQGLARNEMLMQTLKKILALLQSKYEYPVDIEYTINLSTDGTFLINLLQCRPLQIAGNSSQVTLPSLLGREQVLFHTNSSSMGPSIKQVVSMVVYVDPHKYYELPYKQKPNVANAIHRINHSFQKRNSTVILFVPGRIGTSSPELGVPVVFGDISEFSAICEISYSKAGYRPELSFGSHMFQDLVEENIFYCALFENEKTLAFQPNILDQFGKLITTQYITTPELHDVIRVYSFSDDSLWLYHDMHLEEAICFLPLELNRNSTCES